MINVYDTFRRIKTAGVIGATGKATGNGVSFTYNAGKGLLGGTYDVTKDTLNNLNPVSEADRGTLGYSLGKALTEFFLPKFYDTDNAGRYAEYVDYLKQTEEGDQLLREAAKLRRRARILLRQLQEEEKNKRHAASSRYF